MRTKYKYSALFVVIALALAGCPRTGGTGGGGYKEQTDVDGKKVDDQNAQQQKHVDGAR